MFSALTSHLTLVLAFMISLADYASVAVFLGCSPSLVVITYLWLVVYSASQMIKKQEIRSVVLCIAVQFRGFLHFFLFPAPEDQKLRLLEPSQPHTRVSPL